MGRHCTTKDKKKKSSNLFEPKKIIFILTFLLHFIPKKEGFQDTKWEWPNLSIREDFFLYHLKLLPLNFNFIKHQEPKPRKKEKTRFICDPDELKIFLDKTI